MAGCARAMRSELRRCLQRREKHYRERLREMVEINSFTYNSSGVDAVAAMTEDLFAPLSFIKAESPPAGPSLGSHLALTSGNIGSPHLCTIGLISHHDTVYPPSSSQSFCWRECGGVDDRIVGPGTSLSIALVK